MVIRFASVTLAHTVSTEGCFSTSNPKTLQDYSRLERTIFNRENVSHLEVVVVGAGALGNEVVKALGLLGVARVLVIDPDCVRPSDLTRSLLFRKEDYAGRNKAVAMVEAAGPLFPGTEFVAIPAEIADVGFGRFAQASLLFSCVDNDLARLEMSYLGTKLGLPVADAGLGAPNYAHGRVSWYPGQGGACFGCKLTPGRRRELLNYWDAEVRSCSDALPDGQRPSTPTMAAIVGSLEVELGLRWRMENCRESVTFEVTLEGTPRSQFFRTPVSAECPFHESRDEVMVDAVGQATVAEILESVKAPADGAPYLILDWPICCRARCSACCHEWAPMQRAAVIRRRAVCPACGSRSILEQESIRVIGHNSPWARKAPSALGLPEQHRFTIRFHRGHE